MLIPDPRSSRPDREFPRKDGLQFGNAVVLHNPFDLNATTHKRMELAMIGIGSRRQPVHAETLSGMKVFGSKGAFPTPPATVVSHGMRLHRLIVPPDYLPGQDRHGRGRIKRYSIQKDDLRTFCLTQGSRKENDKQHPAKTKKGQH